MNAGGHRPADRHGREDLLGRLQAADPARALPTDTAALRAAVDRRIAQEPATGDLAAEESAAEDSVAADSAAGDSVAGDSAEPTPVAQGPEDPQVAAGTRGAVGALSARHWIIAAALAAALAVGGYGLGAQRAQPPISADRQMASSQDAPPTRAPDQDAAESAGQQETMPGSSAAPRADAGRLVFVDGGLPTQSGQAEAWALDAGSVYQPEALAAIAADLGLDGQVQGGEGQAIEVVDGGRSVRIEADGLATLVYRDEGARGMGAPTNPQDAAGQFLDTLGVDASAWRMQTQDLLDGFAVQVIAEPEAGPGSATPWQITVTEGGVSHATGPLAQPQSLGEYPTISAAAALDRLTDPTFGAGATPVPQSRPITQLGPSAPPAVPDAGSQLPWPDREVEFTGATLAVAEYHIDDGRVLVLPTWTLDAGAAGSWQVLAVSASALDTG
ncbi:MAG TPA: hypothetical protein VK095_11475 [Beutenbergiaceae bacterium]|nr:hypothetical protein [Beutenbergiaceae bacterium]